MSRVALSEPVSVWPLAAPLLEGPVWIGDDAVLWFVDIKSRRIHRYHPATGAKRSWDAPEQVGFVLPLERSGFVAGLQRGLHRFDPHTGSFLGLRDPEPDRPGNRLNDATVDPTGRLWFGTMDDGEAEATGAIYRLGDDGECVAATPRVSITNGPAISPDGRTLYHVDTLGGVIHACSLGEDGTLNEPRVFATIDPADGHPDGPTCDAEGCVWIGLYNGWGVRRYSPAGELLETVSFPVSAITKIAFGGPDLKTAYATTANKHLSDAERADQPGAGDLFAFDVDVPGLASVPIRHGV